MLARPNDADATVTTMKSAISRLGETIGLPASMFGGSATRVPPLYIERMRKVLVALFLFSCGTSPSGPDASATNDATTDVATETGPEDASDGSATLGLPRVYV